MSDSSHSGQLACSGPCVAPGPLPRAIAWLQWTTLVWMLFECGISLYAAAQANSLALLAFGADSLIELLSATIVLLQFLPHFPLSKQRAEKSASILLVLLAIAIAVMAALAHHSPVEASPLGLVITALALLVMPVLAALKRRQAAAISNRALAADATQSATCAYLAAVTLAGLAINALWHLAWVDRVAALAAIPILIVEARRAWRGDSCGCCAAIE
ncbi:MAG: cation transporter [Terracidiphilus sp.]